MANFGYFAGDGGGVLVSEREVKWIKVLMRGVDVAIFEACVAADGL